MQDFFHQQYVTNKKLQPLLQPVINPSIERLRTCAEATNDADVLLSEHLEERRKLQEDAARRLGRRLVGGLVRFFDRRGPSGSISKRRLDMLLEVDICRLCSFVYTSFW